jgi:putative ABC transport system substrate-binding protein
LGLTLLSLTARQPGDFAEAFAAASREQAGAVIVLQDALTIAHAKRIVDLAAHHHLPAMYGLRDFTDVGGLMSYGVKPGELEQRAAARVDEILKGAKPADLPIEQPTTFELVINLKTAKALDLRFPQVLLLRADHLIR